MVLNVIYIFFFSNLARSVRSRALIGCVLSWRVICFIKKKNVPALIECGTMVIRLSFAIAELWTSIIYRGSSGRSAFPPGTPSTRPCSGSFRPDAIHPDDDDVFYLF